MSLSTNYSDIGNINWSLDAISGSATGGGAIEVAVPEGSTVDAAFLYASTFDVTVPIDTPTPVATLSSGGAQLILDDTAWTAFDDAVPSRPDIDLVAYRADVTEFVSDVVGSGRESTFEFAVSNVPTDSVDGYALVVVYSNPAEPVRSVFLTDGSSNVNGDRFSIDFAEPVETSDTDFSILLSLGIGFSAQPQTPVQSSEVDVNGVRLTTAAGGQDDGSLTNGALITIGGIGDDPSNPANPFQLPSQARDDDELYDLARPNGNGIPFLEDGDTSVIVDTINPSNDDNIFFAGFLVDGEAFGGGEGNDPPVAVDDEATTDAATSLTINATTNDVDPDGDAVQLVSIAGVDVTVGETVTLPSGALVTLSSASDITYDPNGRFDDLRLGETVTESFAYRISDGEFTSSPGLVNVTVEGLAEPPEEDVTIMVGDAAERFLRTEPTAWADAWTSERLDYSHKANLDDTSEVWSEVDFGTRLPGTLAGSDMWRGDLGVSGGGDPGSQPQLITENEALRVLFPTVEANSIDLELALFEAGERGEIQFLDASGAVFATRTFDAASASFEVEEANGLIIHAAEGSGFLLDSLSITGTDLLAA